MESDEEKYGRSIELSAIDSETQSFLHHVDGEDEEEGGFEEGSGAGGRAQQGGAAAGEGSLGPSPRRKKRTRRNPPRRCPPLEVWRALCVETLTLCCCQL